jgi:protein tyrosine/serine phosphatase
MRSFSFACICSLSFTFLLVCMMCSCASTTKQCTAGACSDNLGSAIQNFCVVTPSVLWRGARPDKDGAAWLIQQGVRTIVNLELILDDKPAFGHATVADDKNYEVDYFRIHEWEPLPLLAPSVVDDHVAHFIAIVSQQPKPVYVHCRSGVNRTGVMAAAYRVLIEGVSDEDAIEEMRRYRGQWFKADSEYIRGLSPKRREEIHDKVMKWIPKLKKDAQVVCANGICAVSDH